MDVQQIMGKKPPSDTIWIYAATPFISSVLWLGVVTALMCAAYIVLLAPLVWLLWGQFAVFFGMLFVGGKTVGQRLVAMFFTLIFAALQWVVVLVWAAEKMTRPVAG